MGTPYRTPRFMVPNWRRRDRLADPADYRDYIAELLTRRGRSDGRFRFASYCDDQRVRRSMGFGLLLAVGSPWV